MTSLTTALPLTNGIDNQICFTIIDYLTNTNVWTKQVFSSSQYAYARNDLPSKNRPAVFCYPIQSEKSSFAYSQKGTICLELHFSLQEQRINLAENVIQIANLIQLINLNQKFTQNAQETMYGLFWIGKYCKTDYTKIYNKESIVKIILDYNVDLLAYSQGLQANGYDITSPDEQIYVLAQELLISNDVLNDELQPI